MVLVPIQIEKNLSSIKEVTLLGDWCKNDCTNTMSKISTLTYHWSDKKKQLKDYTYICDLYEKLLPFYVEALNNYHQTNHSILFWRIVCGKWLNNFITLTFDRWSMAEIANNSCKLKEIILLDADPASVVPENLGNFIALAQNSDEWNSYIFYKIFSRFDGLILTKIKNISKNRRNSTFLLFKKYVKSIFFKSLSKLSQLLSKENSIFIINSYLPIKSLWRIERKLNQFPSFYRFDEVIKLSPVNLKKRERLNIEYNSINDFENLLIPLIQELMPKAYLEDYDYILSKFNNFPNFQNINAIFSANTHLFNDQFNIWCAHANEGGTKLVIGQHGGGTKSVEIDSNLDHELSICDHYIAWGKGGVFNKKNVVLPINKSTKNTPIKNKIKQTDILLVLDSHNRFIVSATSDSSEAAYGSYVANQRLFISLIDKDIIQNLKIRPNKNSNIIRWCKSFDIGGNHPIDKRSSFITSLKNSRLIVISANQTTFLQALAMDIPTIAFWDIDQNMLNKDSQSDYQSLYDIGILHNSPELAAKHLNENWHKIEIWWNTPELQIIKNEFCRKFSYTSTDNDKDSQWAAFFKKFN